MLDINNRFINEIGFNDYPEAVERQSSKSTLGSEAGNDERVRDLLGDLISFTRVNLTSYGVLSAADEYELAMELERASKEIARHILTWHSSASELLNLISTAMQSPLKKQQFKLPEHYFALRSELLHLMKAGSNESVVPLLSAALTEDLSRPSSAYKLSKSSSDLIASIDWSGSLMTALADRYTSSEESTSSLISALNLHFQVTRVQIDMAPPPRKLMIELKNLERNYFRARERLVKHNLRLVFHIAKRYSQRPDQLVDLVQEGTFGLIRAAEKFRHAKGYRFSTYAYQWIESKVRSAQVNIDRVIAISPDYNQDLARLTQWLELKQEEKGDENKSELLSSLDINKERLDTLVNLMHANVSMDAYAAEEELSLHAKIPAPNSDLFESISSENYSKYLNAIMDKVLTSRECYIINERFGRLCSDPKTLKEISGILGISRERVRQLEIAALAKLREWMLLYEK